MMTWFALEKPFLFDSVEHVTNKLIKAVKGNLTYSHRQIWRASQEWVINTDKYEMFRHSEILLMACKEDCLSVSLCKTHHERPSAFTHQTAVTQRDINYIVKRKWIHLRKGRWLLFFIYYQMWFLCDDISSHLLLNQTDQYMSFITFKKHLWLTLYNIH